MWSRQGVAYRWMSSSHSEPDSGWCQSCNLPLSFLDTFKVGIQKGAEIKATLNKHLFMAHPKSHCIINLYQFHLPIASQYFILHLKTWFSLVSIHFGGPHRGWCMLLHISGKGLLQPNRGVFPQLPQEGHCGIPSGSLGSLERLAGFV